MNTYELALVTVNTVVLVALPFLSRLADSYLAGYLDEKARHLATKEDFNALLEQTKQTTAATEEIRKKLEGGLWLDQELWKARLNLYSRLLDYYRTVLEGASVAFLETTAKGRMTRFFELLREKEKDETPGALTKAALLLRPKMARQLGDLRRQFQRMATDDTRWEGDRLGSNYGLLYVFYELMVSAAREDLRAFTAEEQGRLNESSEVSGVFLDHLVDMIERQPDLSDKSRQELLAQAKAAKAEFRKDREEKQ